MSNKEPPMQVPDFNEPLYRALLAYATECNSVEVLTFEFVSATCLSMGTHIENEEITLAQMYINIARALVLPTLDFPKENKKKLDTVRKSLICYDVVKLQKFTDVAFTPLYEKCVINALTKFNMTEEHYNELHDIQCSYGISRSKSTEIENDVASNVVSSLIDELIHDGLSKDSLKFVKTFVDSIRFTLNDKATSDYNRFVSLNQQTFGKK